jgi:hypothetical protein
MKTMSTTEKHSPTSKAAPHMGSFRYKTFVIYPRFADVGTAVALLNKEGFTNDQISLLGREQPHWQENIKEEWDALKTAKGALGGAALGSIPGLVIITGMALTGGVGLLAAGPLVVALSTLGVGALSGGLVGGGSAMGLGLSDLNTHEKTMEMDIGAEIKDAISLGHWIVIAHTHNESEAMHAQGLLPGSRTVHEHESK